MTTRRPWAVLAGVDRSAPSRPAVGVAALEASMRRLPLRLICAYPPSSGCGPVPPSPASATQARRRVAAAAAWVADTYPDVTVGVGVRAGAPASVLSDAAREADLLVVGHRERSGHTRSTAVEIIARVGCPVIVTGSNGNGATRAPLGPVVIGLRGDDRDDAVVGFAFEEAALRGVALQAAHVWLNVPDMELASVDPFVYDLAEARRDADRLIGQTLDGWGHKYPHVPVLRLPMYQVDVAGALAAASAGAGLLVLGSPQRGSPRGGPPGPVGGALVSRANCPVAFVHRVR